MTHSFNENLFSSSTDQIGTGILHPQQTNQFRVLVLDSVLSEEESRLISQQLIRFHVVHPQSLTKFGALLGDSSVEINLVLQHPVGKNFYAVLRKLLSQEFTLQVDLLDGCDNATENLVFQNCSITEHTFSALDYSHLSEILTHYLTLQSGPKAELASFD